MANAANLKPRWRCRWRWLFAVPLVLAVGSMLQVLTLRFVDPPVSAFMLARQFDAWGDREWRFRPAYDWRDLNTIAACVPLSVIAAEDQNFAWHSGFDLKAIESAREKNAQGRSVQGASTLSQQTAKNLFLWSGRNYVRKGIEAWYTVLIELLWPKRRIVEVYINIAEFGDGIYGAQAAAHSFWRKDAHQLTAQECARLAAVLPSPRRYSAVNPGPYVQRRVSWIQRQVRQLGGTRYLEKLK